MTRMESKSSKMTRHLRMSVRLRWIGFSEDDVRIVVPLRRDALFCQRARRSRSTFRIARLRIHQMITIAFAFRNEIRIWQAAKRSTTDAFSLHKHHHLVPARISKSEEPKSV